MEKNHSSKRRNWFLSVLLKSQKLSSDGGYILVIVLGLVLGISVLLALQAKSSRVEQLNTTASVDSNTGFYAAEAGLNLRAEEIRQIFISYEQPNGAPPSSTKACLDEDSSNDGSGEYKCKNYNFTSATKDDNPHFATTYVVAKNNGQPTVGTVPKGAQFQNLNMMEYGHALYSLAFKEKTLDSQPVAILQMDIKTRIIPMFQFAAFYTGDLEILPGPEMLLSGPVHTNGNLYLGSDNRLRIKSQVTTVGDIYNRRKNNNDTYADGKVQIIDLLGQNFLNLLYNGTGSTQKTTKPMDPKRIATAWGTQVLVNTDTTLSIPKPDILNKDGDYYQKADIRFNFKPSATSSSNMNYLTNVPFSVTVIHRTDSTGEKIVNPVEDNLTEGQLRSLRQPILVKSDLANIPPSSDYNLCKPLSYPSDGYDINFKTWWDGLTEEQKRNFATSAQTALIYAIQSQLQPVNYSLVVSQNSSESIENLDSSYSNFEISFKTAVNDVYVKKTGVAPPLGSVEKLSKLTPAQIAGLPYQDTNGNSVQPRCFVSAPVLEVGRDQSSHQSPFRYHNEREGLDLRLLQLNLQSMAVWNRDGIYLNYSNGSVTGHNDYQGFSADQLLYVRAPADNSAPTYSWQQMGMAAIDTTQEGIVIYSFIDSTIYPKAKTNKSPYGFAIVRGQQLFALGKTNNNSDPTGITIATDQAIYPQGDYNILNKQPASFLADSFNPLSNACLNEDRGINHGKGIGCDIDGANGVRAVDTEFNAAILSATDITQGSSYNGGLENYPRFQENWSGKTWKYRGSFISISTPLYVSGSWQYGGDIYTAPIRDWDYDEDFNDPRKLPPLTPQFVHLKQESFIRSFE